MIEEEKSDSESDLTQSLDSGIEIKNNANLSEGENTIASMNSNSSSLAQPYYERKMNKCKEMSMRVSLFLMNMLLLEILNLVVHLELMSIIRSRSI